MAIPYCAYSYRQLGLVSRNSIPRSHTNEIKMTALVGLTIATVNNFGINLLIKINLMININSYLYFTQSYRFI